MRTLGRFFLSAFLVSVAVLATILILSGRSSADPVDLYDDWVITTDLEYDGDIITVRGHIQIKDGGSLTLINSTLRVDSRQGSAKRFTVEASGNLYAYNSTITNRYANNNNERFFFDVKNDSVFKECTLSRLYGWNSDNPGGLRLLGGSHVIEDCIIYDSRTYGVYTVCPLYMVRTRISSTGWGRLVINTNGRLYPMDFTVDNCTFVGNVNNPYSYGVYTYDGYTGSHRRDVNISYCTFEGLSYGIYLRSPWQNAFVDIGHNTFDRCTYGSRITVNYLDVRLMHNHYVVRGGGTAIWLYQGSYGNITWGQEDIRGASLGSGTGIQLHGVGTVVQHTVRDISIWGTYYGITSDHGPAIIRDCYVNTTNNNFEVSDGATMDIYTTEHRIGSGFVWSTGGRITAWQRVNISSVRWADGTSIAEGIIYLLNETDDPIGTVNLSLGERHLDFKRWETRRSYIWENQRVLPGLLDRDTYFYADELDILVTEPQEIVFTDDFVPVLTAPGLEPGYHVNRSYLIMEGDVIERGQGLRGVEVSLDGAYWELATVTGESWDFAFATLEDGLYDISVRALDYAGNVGLLEFPGVIVDTRPPFLIIEGGIPEETNQSMLHLEGRTEPGATLFLGDLTVVPDEEGNFTIDFPLTEGMNGLVLLVRDRVGNWNQTVMQVKLDTIAPLLTLLTPSDGLVTNSDMIFLSGRSSNDAIVTVEAEGLDPISIPVFKGTFTKEIALTEGVWDLTVRAADEAGNFNDVSVTVTVDLTAPTLVITSPSSYEISTTAERIYIVGAMDADIENVFINGLNLTTLPGEFALPVDLEEGRNTFTIVVMDPAGNENRVVIVVLRDSTAPDYSIDPSSRDGTIVRVDAVDYTDANTIVFTGWVNEMATFAIDGTEIEGEGEFSFDYLLADGRNDVTIEVTDLAGNQAEPFRYTVVFDSDPPGLKLTWPSDGFVTEEGEVKVTGNVDEGGKVWVNGIPASKDAQGNFELTLPLDWGDNTFTVKAEDHVGNEIERTVVVKREKEEEVKESNASMYAIMLIIGVIIGAVVMVAKGMLGRGGEDLDEGPMERPPEAGSPEEEPSPYSPESSPSSDGPKEPWEEY